MFFRTTKLCLNIILILSAILLSVNGMEYNPKSLRALAGRALAKNITSICNLPMPEECKQYLGVIELQEIGPKTNIEKTFGGYSSDSKEYLNIDSIEYFSKKSFAQLIDEQNKKGLPFILAVVTIKQDQTYTHLYYNAHSLNKKLFSMRRNAIKRYGLRDPQISLPIIGEIQYFTINGTEDIKANFLCTDYDLYYNDVTVKFLSNFFDANKSIDIAQGTLAYLYQEKGDLEKAKHYYMLAAEQGYDYAQSNLADLYEGEGNAELAKHYYALACDKGNSYAQYTLAGIYSRNGNKSIAMPYYILAAQNGYINAQLDLGSIYKQENDIVLAKYYYTLAASQNCPHAQRHLADIYINEGNIQQAKRYYAAAARQGDTDAHFNLAQIYEEKEGNISIAKHYYDCAIKKCLKAISDSQVLDTFITSGRSEAEVQCISGFIAKEHGNIETAKEHFLNAANLGNTTAQYHLGLIFLQEQDIEMGKIYLSLASKKGHILAQLQLKDL